MTLRSQTRTAEYHAKASDAAALAASSVLQRVRELHQLAASRWTQLAELEDRRTSSLARRFGKAAQVGRPPRRPSSTRMLHSPPRGWRPDRDAIRRRS